MLLAPAPGRVALPLVERAEERARVLVAEDVRGLGQVEPRVQQVVVRELAARVLQDLLEGEARVRRRLAMDRRSEECDDESEPPAQLDPGVVMERHHALNWLTGFHGADWDDVDTPT